LDQFRSQVRHGQLDARRNRFAITAGPGLQADRPDLTGFCEMTDRCAGRIAMVADAGAKPRVARLCHGPRCNRGDPVRNAAILRLS
jgi:hypothetical protein